MKKLWIVLCAFAALLGACGRNVGLSTAPREHCDASNGTLLTKPLTPAESTFDHETGIPIITAYACHGIIATTTP